MAEIRTPAPDADALDASRALCGRIAGEIDACGGWIDFARYMELALYSPGLGYYAGGSAKLGAAGDFVTAPGLGSLFGRTLANQLADLLGPGDAVLEFGAGTGALAESLIGALSSQGCTPEYLVLETSAELAGRQRARLGPRARWIDRMPERFRGVMIANEVADAMPVHALAWQGEEVLERGVSIVNGRFAWRDRPAAGAALAAAQAIDPSRDPDGRYESEIALAAPAWMRAVATGLERGAVFVIDYGFVRREYYHPQRSRGTLMCHYRHRAHDDPFHLPGLEDITAHVDFSSLATAAQSSGLEPLGYTTQAQFLVNCGITGLLAGADAADARRYAPLAAEAQRLLSPAEMGELFKVLAVGKGIAGRLRGFSQGNRVHTL